METKLGLDFITRSIKTTSVVLVVVLAFGMLYLGVYESLALFSGGVWGILNLMFLSILVQETIKPGEIKKAKVALLLLGKFPLLYASGYALMVIDNFNQLYLVAGFSLVLAIIVLKVVSRVIFVNQNNSDSDRLHGANS